MSDFNFKPEDLIDKEAIAQAVKEKIKNELVESAFSKVRDMATKEISEILEDDIKQLVQDQKANILKGLREGMPDICKAVANELATRAEKNISSFSGNEIIKKMFGVY